MNTESILHRHNNRFSIGIAETEQEILAFRQLVFRKYCEELRWLDPEEYPEGFVTDEYDQNSSVVIVSDKDGLAGSIRMVHSGDRPFPHEYLLEKSLPSIPLPIADAVKKRLAKIPRSNMVEATRVISARKNSAGLSTELAKVMHWYGIYAELEAFYLAIDVGFFQLSTKIGFPIHPIGIPQLCEGSWVIPGIVIHDQIAENIRKYSEELYEHIVSPHNLIGSWESNRRMVA